MEREGQATSPTSADFLSEALRDVQGESARVNNGASDMVGGADSLLPIVSSQRERFKQRNVELEAVSSYCKPIIKVELIVGKDQ